MILKREKLSDAVEVIEQLACLERRQLRKNFLSRRKTNASPAKSEIRRKAKVNLKEQWNDKGPDKGD